jgi:hypothetical protein
VPTAHCPLPTDGVALCALQVINVINDMSDGQSSAGHHAHWSGALAGICLACSIGNNAVRKRFELLQNLFGATGFLMLNMTVLAWQSKQNTSAGLFALIASIAASADALNEARRWRMLKTARGPRLK